MKIYILTCVREDGELVFAWAFRTKADAQENLKINFDARKHQFESETSLGYAHLKKNSAALGDDYQAYIWKITPATV